MRACLALAALALIVALAPSIGKELDLLESLSLLNSSRQGVTAAAGPEPLRPAYAFTGDFREVKMPLSVFDKAVDLLQESPEFTILTAMRQENANSGTIVSFSHGVNSWRYSVRIGTGYLELQSSARKNEVRLHYVVAGTETPRMETFPFGLADGTWHQVAVTVSGSEVRLFIDCKEMFKKIIMPPDRNFSQPQLGLWIGQRNSKHSLFKGALQNLKFINGPHGYLNQCPEMDSQCPTCGEFTLLKSTVEQLYTIVENLTRLTTVQGEMIKTLQKCDCQKSCTVNDLVHADGLTWQKDCNKCSCVHGDISCRPVECPATLCKNPVLHPGECCPTCLKQCYLQGVLYEHGDLVVDNKAKQCVECECKDGSMECSRIDPEMKCPPLPCKPSEQLSVTGECCKFCPGADYCNTHGHKCSVNATCINLNTDFSCNCNQGFQGNGFICEDIDECLSEGGLYGHHCHQNTRCTNTVGSYTCECEKGYARADKFNCVEIDECSTGEHLCSPYAFCNNTAGSYSCQCIKGYEGDGYKCEPSCNGGCWNGGTCISPDKCECRPGFTGQHCERDRDECKTNDNNICPYAAVCVNMPGWYYCKCKPGYRSLPKNVLSTTCQDIDECAEELHTCHASAKCINTEGSFMCECVQPDCRLSCMYNNQEMPDGKEWIDKCQICKCNKGVLSCSMAPCQCNSHPAAVLASGYRLSPDCCPQCNPKHDCRHQELQHIIFHSGEQWVYQCQTCECLLGEIDCWKLECPAIDNTKGEVACCSSMNGATGAHIAEALCSPNSSTPCPQAAHHTAPDCQMAYCATLGCHVDGLCVGLVGGSRMETSATSNSPKAPRRKGTTVPLEPG